MKSPIVPTVGRIVHYVLPPELPGLSAAIRPAIIVRVWERTDGETPLVQLQVFTDGRNDCLGDRAGGLIWATSVHYSEGNEPGTWHWMPYQLKAAPGSIGLGSVVRDRVSGFVGTVTARCEYRAGNIRVEVRPSVLPDGSVPEDRWFDPLELDLVEQPVATPA